MLTDHDEQLVQRCVDGELTSDERRELLSRLDQTPDGWKTLACTFVEEQLFADAANDRLQQSPHRTISQDAAAQTPSDRKPAWLSSPITTLVLSLSVAFLSGVLIAGQFDGGNGANQVIADSSAADINAEPSSTVADRPSGAPAPVATTVANAPYSMRVEPVGEDPIELPVFSDSDVFLQQLEEFQRQTFQTSREAVPERSASDLQFIRVVTKDGRIILLPLPRQNPSLQ